MNQLFRFCGTYCHNLDDKGRLALPGRLREELQKSAYPEKVTALLDDKGYVTIYPYEQWLKVQDDINAITQTKLRQALSRKIMGQSEDLSLDKSGRILLSARHRQGAGLDKEVAVVGSGYKFELWEASQLEAQFKEDEALLSEHFDDLLVNL